jgi:cytochrome c5
MTHFTRAVARTFATPLVGAVAGLMLVSAPRMAAAQSVGETIYKQSCAGCHDNPETRAPSKANLSAMPAQTIAYALSDGKMKTQGQPKSK